MRARSRSASLIHSLELTLWIAGIAAIGYCLSICVIAFASQRAATSIAQAANSSQPQPQVPPKQQGGEAHVIGQLVIPQLALTVPVFANDDPTSLRRGVGHIEGTANPGGLGTIALAGHRDTYFRPLRRIAAKMQILLSDPSGVYHYEVDSTEIVTPDHVEVIATRSTPAMTLITCYPFDFVGAAPRRFIVHAHLLSVAADTKIKPEDQP
ncbi:sortase [Granulicella arctica]|uniref:Sortase A n=1 Tax=Granulicella arctica TaxID=940613 RepID=A0A7Y9PLF9_9BACT|nr:sortase A [Granulicella arctica]